MKSKNSAPLWKREKHVSKVLSTTKCCDVHTRYGKVSGFMEKFCTARPKVRLGNFSISPQTFPLRTFKRAHLFHSPTRFLELASNEFNFNFELLRHLIGNTLLAFHC